jgi:hypothetical protein
MKVPLPARYPVAVQDANDEKVRPAIGAAYFYVDKAGTSVIAESVYFEPAESSDQLQDKERKRRSVSSVVAES